MIIGYFFKKVTQFYQTVISGEIDPVTNQTGVMMNTETQIRLLDINAVKAITGIKSNTSVYTMIRERNFPEPITIGRTNRWIEAEVQAWLVQLIKDNRGVLLAFKQKDKQNQFFQSHNDFFQVNQLKPQLHVYNRQIYFVRQTNNYPKNLFVWRIKSESMGTLLVQLLKRLQVVAK